MSNFENVSGINSKFSMFNSMNSEGSEGKFTFSMSDNILTKDLPTTCGSKMLEGFQPVYESTLVAGLQEMGGSLVGKAAMDEFGFGPFSTTSAYNVPRNPYCTDKVAGANGSACASMVIDEHVAIGTSVSGPASFCGAYSLVPTYGRVSRFGLIEQGSSLERIGLCVKNPATIRTILPALCKKDTSDVTSCVQPELELTDVKAKRIAVLSDKALGDVDEDVMAAYHASIDVLKNMGVEIVEVEMPAFEYAVPAFWIFATTESASSLAKFTGMRYGQQDGDYQLKFDDYFTDIRTKYFGEEVKKMIILGTYTKIESVRDKYYVKSHKVRNQIKADYAKIFETCDAFMTPTMPITAPSLECASNMASVDKMKCYRFTAPAELAGVPQLNVPCGYDKDGMPVGIQFVSAQWNESVLVNLAEAWSANFEMKEVSQ